MEDELEDRIFYQTYLSHMKLMSKFAVGLHLNGSNFGYIWKLLRFYLLKPEILILGAFIVGLIVYIQAVEVWSHSLLGRINFSLGRSSNSKVKQLNFFNGDVDKLSWELKNQTVAAYAVQGRRPGMEDRFVVNENINNTGVSLFAVFDGHGGEFAANYARDNLINNVNNKVIELKKMIAEGIPDKISSRVGRPPPSPRLDQKKVINPDTSESLSRKSSFRKTQSQADESVRKSSGSGIITDLELLEKLDSLNRPITREVRPTRLGLVAEIPPPKVESYLQQDCGINYGRLLTDEVLAADRLLVEAAKKTMDIAGTTALIALLEGSRLIVANVGDSRGVMCDGKGNAIPLSFDHKPQQMREKKRIKAAGGFVTFNGVWRVAGILATSRALGDYPLKDKRFVIADPDILTFDLADHKPQFLILASDGLWDTFSNEEAVSFIKDRLGEPHFGAKSITLQAFYRGSLDNITVIVINLSEQVWSNITTTPKKHNNI